MKVCNLRYPQAYIFHPQAAVAGHWLSWDLGARHNNDVGTPVVKMHHSSLSQSTAMGCETCGQDERV
jgi:hypothetical protein